MKRSELVKALLSEGFSDKTLSILSDNQINVLAERILGEAIEKQIKKVTYSPSEVSAAKTKGQGITVNGSVTMDKDGGMTVTQGEQDMSEEEDEDEDTESLNEWVGNLVQNNYHSIVKKGEISEIIKNKVNEK